MRIVLGLLIIPSPWKVYSKPYILEIVQQFLETIRIERGESKNLQWHQRRVEATMQHFFPAHQHSWNLKKCIEVPVDFQREQKIRCRILYDAHLFSIHYYPYQPRIIQSLKMVAAPAGYDYSYKYADRKIIEDLYSLKEDADDILITRNGWITDTSIANITFGKNGRWYTPSLPLLAGTTWKRLIHSEILIPKPIHQEDVMDFESFKIINAMNDFDTAPGLPVLNIRL